MYISFHFKHIPLKQMIALLFLVCSFLPMLIMNFYAYTVAADQAKERVETQSGRPPSNPTPRSTRASTRPPG